MAGWLRVLLSPSCWLQQHPYSEEWERRLRSLLGNEPFTNFGRHTAEIGGHTVWIANRPYASMSTYGTGVQVRPARATILEAHDWLATSLVRAELEGD